MDAQTVIESYVRDVTRRLPRRTQGDVALELRALLSEELSARAASGVADEAMAIELVRAFGAPDEVAARYRPTPPLLEAADTRPFLTWAIVGALVLAGLAPVTHPADAKNAATVAILAWVGLVALFFITRNWAQRHWPSLTAWRPRDPDRASRLGSLALVAVIGLGALCYGAPQQVFGTFIHGARLPASLVYAPGFAATRLPWLLAIWGLQAALFAWLLVQGRWRPLTRQVGAALQLAVALALVWFYADGPIMQAPGADRIAKGWMAVIAIGLLADAAWKIAKLMRPSAPPIQPGAPTVAA